MLSRHIQNTANVLDNILSEDGALDLETQKALSSIMREWHALAHQIEARLPPTVSQPWQPKIVGGTDHSDSVEPATASEALDRVLS